MAKISALPAQTGSGADVADDLVTVDVSDNTMAASGTDKYITIQEFAKGLATLRLVPFVYFVDTLGVAFQNTLTSTTIISGTLPVFPTMAVGDQLHIMSAGTFQTSGAASTLAFSLLNGATTLFTATTSSLALNASSRAWFIDLTITCVAVGNAAAGSVMIEGECAVSVAGVSNNTGAISANTTALVGGGTVACATDGSGGNLDLQMQMSTTTSLCKVISNGASILYIPKVI